MSQKATRKSQNTTAPEEKDKFETPVKEMKKKLAANAEKDKQAAEKVEKTTEKNDKNETADKNKPNDKTDKHTDKSDKQEKVADKKTEKVDKNSDKKAEKTSDKSVEKKVEKTAEKTAEKKVEKIADKNVEKVDKTSEKKVDKPTEKKAEHPDKNDNSADKAKESPAVALNGNTQARGDANGTASDGSSDELVIEDDENFPELAYDESETEAEPDAPARSFTRRSQVKVTKTPETPRPASDKDGDDSKELEKKLLKLKDEVVPPSDRKLRSADSPKRESKKHEKKQESPKKQESEEEKKAPSKKDLEGEMEVEQAKDAKPEEKADKSELEVVIEVESAESSSKRARVSPYSRPRHDRTRSSVMAEYSGNNSTMETTMDVTESSFLEEPSLNDSGYLRGLRGIRGRSSYKLLKEVTLTNPNANRPRPPPQVVLGRPTGAVVGRKRKPSFDTAPHSPAVDVAEEASDEIFAAHGKRMRLLDRLSMTMPFRRTRHTEIVGINTDLPLTAPVASTSLDSFDPESIKPAAAPPAAAPAHDRNARCVVM